jgi:hypothetical protein
MVFEIAIGTPTDVEAFELLRFAPLFFLGVFFTPEVFVLEDMFVSKDTC